MNGPLHVDPNCIFCRIIRREAPATIRYETDSVIAFDDHRPHAPTHVLICPKAHYSTFMDTPPEILAVLAAMEDDGGDRGRVLHPRLVLARRKNPGDFNEASA